MFGEANPSGAKTLQINILDVGRRRLEDYLQLRVLIKAIGILAVAAVGGSPAGLSVGDAIRGGPDDAEKSFGMHGARADLDVIRLIENTAAASPEFLQAQNEVLKGKTLF